MMCQRNAPTQTSSNKITIHRAGCKLGDFELIKVQVLNSAKKRSRVQECRLPEIVKKSR